jgi:hypothetical protein
MDDRTGTSNAAKLVLAGFAFLVAIVVARDVLGDLGAQLVLLVTMVAVAALAWTTLTERPLPRLLLPGGAAPAAAPVVEDVWRSERWIAEAVERGLRALEEWRLEQREA